MSVKNSTYNLKNGRYVLGGTTEMSTFGLEWWSRAKISSHPSDIVYVVEKKYEGKPQLLGYVWYGDEGLWWVIAQYNGIIDPIEEIVEGKVLLIPLKDRMQRELFLGKATGGAPSKREA